MVVFEHRTASRHWSHYNYNLYNIQRNKINISIVKSYLQMLQNPRKQVNIYIVTCIKPPRAKETNFPLNGWNSNNLQKDNLLSPADIELRNKCSHFLIERRYYKVRHLSLQTVLVFTRHSIFFCKSERIVSFAGGLALKYGGIFI